MTTIRTVRIRANHTLGWAAVVALLIWLALAGPASAQECIEWEEQRVVDADGRVGWETVCVRYDHGGGNGSDGPGGTWLPTEGVYAVLLTTVDDERCWRVIWIDMPGYERPPDAWTWGEAYDAGQGMWGDSYPVCPGGEEPDPTGAVRALWASTSLLPDTELYVAPGWALAGQPAFLEIRGDRTMETTQSLPAPFGVSATLTASATYTIHWGDGEETAAVQTAGGPWPDGDLRHVYTDAEGLEITVVAEWSGEWRIGAGPARPLPALQVEHSLPIEVREWRAVRVAPDV